MNILTNSPIEIRDIIIRPNHLALLTHLHQSAHANIVLYTLKLIQNHKCTNKRTHTPSRLTLIPPHPFIVYGTDYCDITGETDWVRGMIDQHDTSAKASGARIVHFCGHDCVPWDLCGEIHVSSAVVSSPVMLILIGLSTPHFYASTIIITVPQFFVFVCYLSSHYHSKCSFSAFSNTSLLYSRTHQYCLIPLLLPTPL